MTGDGKTSVRAGAGTFYDRYNDDNILDLVELPPLLNTYTTNYTTINELLASPLTATPTGVSATSIRSIRRPCTTGARACSATSAGISSATPPTSAMPRGSSVWIGRSTAGRTATPINRRIWIRPTWSAASRSRLPDDLLRPIQGYASITQRTYEGFADYHSLQFAVNRRRSADGLTVSVAYTYQISNKNLGAIDPFVSDNRARNYNQGGRRPHTLNINYSYEVPNLSKKWNNAFVKALADNWQVSGITSMLSGTYTNLSYGYTGVPTGALSGQGAINGGGSRVEHPVRSEPAARRADVRPPVPDRVHRTAHRPVQAGRFDERRVPRARAS